MFLPYAQPGFVLSTLCASSIEKGEPLIPLSYVFRNLRRRRFRSLATAVGVALAVGIYTVMTAVASTMVSGFRSTGEVDEVVIVQAGAVMADLSSVPRSALGFVQTLGGVASRDSAPLVSPELRLGTRLDVGTADPQGIEIRGVEERNVAVYRQVRLLRGSWARSGYEATVGLAVAENLGLDVGSTLSFEGADWRVVGLMQSQGCVYDQEIWVDLDDLAASAGRRDLTGFTLRVADAGRVESTLEQVNQNRRFPLRAQTAKAFYARAGASSAAIGAMGSFLALILAVGAVFAGMNTMFTNVAARRREIGVLRAIGYRRWNVLTAVLIESMLICLVGGLLGIGLGVGLARLPFHLPYLANAAVQVQAEHIAQSLSLTLVIGVAGGLLPALQAARLRVIDALQANPGI